MEDVVYLDRGEVELKGLPEPVRLIQVVREGEVPEDAARFSVHRAPSTSLPTQPTPFIGREQEVEEVTRLLLRLEVRLLTLTGPGGTGKTRLALRVAEEVQDTFPDGIVFVSLAPVSDRGLVSSTIATSLKITEARGEPILDSLTGYLREKHLLLVLDNFEHLLEAAVVVSHLLASCPQLKMLVTSRAVLHLAAEHEYPVPPLAMPTPGHLPELDALARYDAIQLFVQRAQAAKPTFQLTDRNAAAVAEICCRLDGLPLAIELAAARVKLFPPEALLQRLSRRLTLLTGGARDLPTRQQTLRSTIDWSYDLLTPDEQTLFARLSVFAGGCTFEAAEAVCNSEAELDLLAGMAALVDKSLLRQEGEEEPRFVMLETVREYAAERLEAQGEAGVVRQRHAQYLLSLIEEAGAGLRGPTRGAWLKRLDRDHDNARAALHWVLERGDTSAALRLATGLADFWDNWGYRIEGLQWLSLALSQEGADRSLRGEALGMAARLAWDRGDYGRAVALSEEQLALVRELGDTRRLAGTLGAFGSLLQHHKNLERATALFEESLALFREDENIGGMVTVLALLARVALRRGEYERATALYQESLTRLQEVGHTQGTAQCLEGMACVLAATGKAERAAYLFAAAARLREAEGIAPTSPRDVQWRDGYVAMARGVLEPYAWERAWEEGRAMTLQQAVDYALREQDPA